MPNQTQIQEILNLTNQRVEKYVDERKEIAFQALKPVKEEIEDVIKLWQERSMEKDVSLALLLYWLSKPLKTLKRQGKAITQITIDSSEEVKHLASENTWSQYILLSQLFRTPIKPRFTGQLDSVQAVTRRIKKFGKRTIKQLTQALRKEFAVLFRKVERDFEKLRQLVIYKLQTFIGRFVDTEIFAAYNLYQMKAISALDNGMLKRWDAVLDLKGCQVCRGLDGEIRPFKESFSTGILQPPQHPYCRCTVTMWKEEWTAGRSNAG